MERARAPDFDCALFGYNGRVDQLAYQKIADLSPSFLAHHAGLLEEAIDENPCSIAFRFAPPAARVLILSAGAGNDAAPALRNGSRAMDTVEIDSAIWQLGQRLHPIAHTSVRIPDRRARIPEA